jgi:hypothetical protein
MSDAYLELAMRDVERHAREAAESDIREGWKAPLRSWVINAIAQWAPNPDVMDGLLDHWQDVYDRTRAELEGSMQHVVRWIGMVDGDGWTLGCSSRYPEYRELTLDEAQSLYETGAVVMLADGIGAPVRTTRSPLQVERDLAND